MNHPNFIKDVVFYSPDLHKMLDKGVLNTDKYNGDGIYLMSFRLLIKDSNMIMYNYIYYPKEFINSMLVYLLVKYDFESSPVYRDWGDYHCLLDEDLFDLSQPIIKELRVEYLLINHRRTNYFGSNYKKGMGKLLDLQFFMD